MFDPKEVTSRFSPEALAGFLHEVVVKARKEGTSLEVLSAILAVVIDGYSKTMGPNEAAMLFYSVADDLAAMGIRYDEGDNDGKQPR